MKNKFFFWIFSALIISFWVIIPRESHASDENEKKMRLAIVDLQSKGISNVVGIAVTDLIRSNMVDTGRFTVVERSQMDAILKEQEIQMTGCTDSSCAVEMGKLLSANKVLIGEINKLGSDIVITVRIVDVEKGVAEFSTNEKAENIEKIDKAVKALVDKMTIRITGKRSLAGETGAVDFYMRGLVPGWGQMYAGKTLKGSIFMGSFAAAGVLCGYSFLKYKDKKKAYDNLGPKESENKFDSYYNEYKQSYNLTVYLAGLLGLIYIANWTDMIFITDSPGVIISGIPCSSGYIAFDVNNSCNPGVNLSDEINLNISYKINF